MSDDILQRQAPVIEKEIERLKTLLRANENEAPNFDALLELAKNYLDNPGEVWKEASIEKKVELQWFVFPKGVTYDGEKMRTVENPFIYMVKKEILNTNSQLVGVQRIELCPHAPKACILPIYYTPIFILVFVFGLS